MGDHQVRLYVGLEALFGDAMDAKKAYIKKLTVSPVLKGEDILWAFNVYLEAHSESVKAFPMVLKALYDEDIVEEAMILAYYNGDEKGPGFDAAKNAAGPFLQWLQTAESDEESDEE